MNGKTPLELLFLTHYKSVTETAEAMNLTIPTLRNWITQTPRNFLKYAREFRALTGTEFQVMVDAVTRQEQTIYGAGGHLDS
jgi:hypothetical protein